MLTIILVIFQLIGLFNCESIEYIGFSALYNPNTVSLSTDFINLYDLPYEYDINLKDLNIYNEHIVNLTWTKIEDINPLVVSKISSTKFKYGIKLLTSAFLKRYIDSHKSTGEEINNLNLYIENLNDNTKISFSNESIESNNGKDSSESTFSYPEQTYNIIMRNKLCLFLRYNIPDRPDLNIGGITYSDLRYTINEMCDSFAYEDYKLNNIGLSGNDKIFNYLFLSPIGTSFDIENDKERYVNYNKYYQLPIGLEHLISLAINDKIQLTYEDIINSIINTSTNTIFNYLMAERGTVNYNIRNTDSFKNAFQYGSRFIESRASFISIGNHMAEYPENLYTEYQDKKWELAMLMKKMTIEENFLYDIKNILVQEGKNIEEFLPFGVYFEDIPFSIYKNSNSKKESYYHLFNSIKHLNLKPTSIWNIVILFENLIKEFEIYDNAYHEEKSVDTENFFNHMKQIYNRFYNYYDKEYKKLINSINYKNNIKYIMNKNELLRNNDINSYYNVKENKFDIDSIINDNKIVYNTNDNDNINDNVYIDDDNTDGIEDIDIDEYENIITLGYDINNNLITIPYEELNNLYLYETIQYDSHGNVESIDNQSMLSFLDSSSGNYSIADQIYNFNNNVETDENIQTYYSYKSNIYEEEQLLLELKLIKFIENLINEKSIKILDGVMNNYLDSLNKNVKKIENYEYVTKDDYLVILNYLANILKNKRLSILTGNNKSYNFEEMLSIYNRVFDLALDLDKSNDEDYSNSLQKCTIDKKLYEELYSSSNNNTLNLYDVLNLSTTKKLILNYNDKYDRYIYNYIPIIIFQKDILYKYENVINKYVSNVEMYNQISIIYFEQMKKKVSTGLIYHPKLEMYLELFYKYYQALIYSDILNSSDYKTDCENSYLGIPYYGCTSYKIDEDGELLKLSDLIGINENYWMKKYIQNIKPMYRNKDLVEYAVQFIGESSVKEDLLCSIEDALIEFYKILSKDFVNYSTLNINSFKILSRYYKIINNKLINKKLSDSQVIFINRYLSYIGKLISLNVNKDINQIVIDGSSTNTEKNVLMTYANIILPLYNHLKTSYHATFNLDNIIDIINDF
ncbi:hypothetical protein BCR36DRAFT_588084 [Piromyces finnis]|uniref:Uncharacterized protein n=1 Tax=Piromyces finnis TaxID=1754191 RepID=A0A1Y1UTJ0_9FUNG|nr:hypothetical protein BCR36DRAFT_588084 [Piromyces finnis]|eukprot:ORX41349.1 hypothetical protein BCR36DRAFT_588084 [Piromyces finnis]